MSPSATKHRPRKLNIDLSFACNIRCTTCRCPDIDSDTGGELLALEAALRAIDEFVALGGDRLALYGGEPLLVPYVYDVVQHATGRGLRVDLTTNAMAATAENTRRLVEGGVWRVTVSVDGDETGHDRIRGTGTFAKTMLTHFRFGRINDQSLAAIWNSETFDDLRRRLSESYLPVCQACCRHADLM